MKIQRALLMLLRVITALLMFLRVITTLSMFLKVNYTAITSIPFPLKPYFKGKKQGVYGS